MTSADGTSRDGRPGSGRRSPSGRAPRVKIFDVARAAGVSPSTVSRVLNGHHDFMSTATRGRVEQAMEELGYVADPRARGLARGRGEMVGVVLHDVASSYMAGMVRAIDQEVASQGYELLLATMHTRPASTRHNVDRLTATALDGLVIIAPPDLQALTAALRDRGVPHVVVDHDGPLIDASIVRPANRHGIQLAVQHLVGLGHRHIGLLLGDMQQGSARVRRSAFREAVAETEEEILTVETAAGYTLEEGFTGGLTMLGKDPRPTAIIASNDASAVGLLRAARHLAVKVPEDLSVVGFDDVPEAALVTPSLTTVRQPIADIGRTAAKMLFDHLADLEMRPRVVEMPVELVTRESTMPMDPRDR